MGALLYIFWGFYVFFLTICLTELLISYSERLDLVNEIPVNFYSTYAIRV